MNTYKCCDVPSSSDSSAAMEERAPAPNSALITELAQRLPQSADLPRDLDALRAHVRSCGCDVDAHLCACSFDVVAFVFALIGGSDAAAERALALATELVSRSRAAAAYALAHAELFAQLIERPQCLVCACALLQRVLLQCARFAAALALGGGFVGLIVEKVPAYDGNENLFVLFSMMDLIFRHLEHDDFYAEVGGVPLIAVPVYCLQQYVFSGDAIVLEGVLSVLGILVKHWTYGISDLLPENVMKRLVFIVREADRMDILGNGALLDSTLNIVNVCLVSFIKAVARRDVMEELINALFYQLKTSRKAFSKILVILSNIANYAEIAEFIFNSGLIPFLIKLYDEMKFEIKESFLFLFCNALYNHPRKMIEVENFEKILIDCFDIANSLKTKKLCVLFMKAIYSLFSEDNDAIEIFDHDEIVEFLVEFKDSVDHDLYTHAESLLDDFFSDSEETPDKLFG